MLKRKKDKKVQSEKGDKLGYPVFLVQDISRYGTPTQQTVHTLIVIYSPFVSETIQ